LPQAANALAFSAGFVFATGLLHLSGIAFGLIVKWPTGRIAVRVVGGAIAAAGVGFLVGVF
jgi:urease accessory protein